MEGIHLDMKHLSMKIIFQFWSRCWALGIVKTLYPSTLLIVTTHSTKCYKTIMNLDVLFLQVHKGYMRSDMIPNETVIDEATEDDEADNEIDFSEGKHSVLNASIRYLPVTKFISVFKFYLEFFLCGMYLT